MHDRNNRVKPAIMVEDSELPASPPNPFQKTEHIFGDRLLAINKVLSSALSWVSLALNRTEEGIFDIQRMYVSSSHWGFYSL
jgi:hypothetical protein